MEQQNMEKLSDNAFNRLVISSIFSIIVCLFIICSTTYAWFSSTVNYGGNEIKTSSDCFLEITVTDASTATVLTDHATGVTLEQGVEYLVTLHLPKDSSSGYCIIHVGNDDYYTDYISYKEVAGVDDGATKSFTLTVNETCENVVFEKRWGIFSKDSDVVNGALVIDANQDITTP